MTVSTIYFLIVAFTVGDNRADLSQIALRAYPAHALCQARADMLNVKANSHGDQLAYSCAALTCLSNERASITQNGEDGGFDTLKCAGQ